MSLPPSPHSRSDPAARFYQGAAGTQYHEGKRGLNPAALEWVLRLRAEKFRPWVAPTDVVFEWGVGSGWNLARLACARRIGTDAADFLAANLHSLGIEFVDQVDALADSSIDCVICHHALEHTIQPALVLSDCARVLKSGGRLIVHVPWEIERRYSRFQPTEPNHHLYTWNAQTLGNLVTVLGWTIEKAGVRRYGYDRFAANFAAAAHSGEWAFRLLRRGLITLRPLYEVELIARR